MRSSANALLLVSTLVVIDGFVQLPFHPQFIPGRSEIRLRARKSMTISCQAQNDYEVLFSCMPAMQRKTCWFPDYPSYQMEQPSRLSFSRRAAVKAFAALPAFVATGTNAYCPPNCRQEHVCTYPCLEALIFEVYYCHETKSRRDICFTQAEA
jgi:hypothetical protein